MKTFMQENAITFISLLLAITITNIQYMYRSEDWVTSLSMLIVPFMFFIAGWLFQIDVSVKRLNASYPLRGLRIINPQLHEKLDNIAENYISLKKGNIKITNPDKYRKNFIIESVEKIIKECEQEISQWSSGKKIDLPVNNKLINMNPEDFTTKNMYGVTLEVDYWKREDGKIFFEENKRMINKGINIERIFCNNKNSLEELKSVIEEHVNAGITTYVINSDYLSNNDLTKDYTIIDDNMVSVIEIYQTKEIAHWISFDCTTIEKFKKIWEKLKFSSTEAEAWLRTV